MGFNLSSFLGGAAKGATELIEEREKENALQIKESIKNMYHNYSEYKKETDKKKTEMRDVVGSLRSFKFSDGPLDEKELIALASDIPTSKAIAEQLTKNPEKFVGLSKSFIKAKDKVPEGMTFSDYVDQYGKTAKMSSEQLAAAVGTRDEGFLNKLVYGENLNKIKAAAAKYGVTAEELYSAGAGRDSKSLPSLLEVDYSKLQKTPEFKDLKDKAMVVMYRAKQEGTDAEILAAAKNMGAIKGTELMAELKEKPKETQQDIEADYGKRILAATNPKEKAKLMSEIRTMQDVWANPSLKKLTEGQQITVGNRLTAYKGIVNATIEAYLPPGGFKTNPVTGDLEVTPLTKSSDFAAGKKAGMEAAIKFGTDQNGKPKSREDQLALASVGIQFDQDGKAFAPKVAFAASETPAPVAPPKRDGRGGGPMAPKPKPDSAAPAMPPRFNTPDVAPVDKATARAQANAAIANKAPADLVAKRFKETYGEDL